MHFIQINGCILPASGSGILFDILMEAAVEKVEDEPSLLQENQTGAVH